jgi:hypothetical protein
MLFQVKVSNAPRTMRKPRLTPAAEALYNTDESQFQQTYGDTYIDEIYGGGEFFGLFMLHTRDESSHTAISADLRVSAGNFLAGGEFTASFASDIKKASRNAEMEIRALISGGIGLRNPRSPAELGELYAQFNKQAHEHPVDYQVYLKEYRYLPLPPRLDPVRQAVRRDTIETCGRTVIDTIALRGRLDYILAHPTQFEAFDAATLKQAQEDAGALIALCGRRAGECTAETGACTTEGIAPLAVALPKRLASVDPIDSKWQHVLQHDERAAVFFRPDFLVGSPIEVQDHVDGGLGRRKIFRNNGQPMGGIFWHPRVSPDAFIVYGAILAEYLKRGDCEGRHGFPTGDEQLFQYDERKTGLVSWGPSDGLDRISHFEMGFLWWKNETGVVSDVPPPSPFDAMFKAALQRPLGG